jgi:2-polyprenyl-6-methoxyphenol hydroxylase-like FAD-dependent oxidoreductase
MSASTGTHIVVVGGSVAGLATALALAGNGHRVTVLERDAAPPPANVNDAFEHWDRRGSPQTRHSHAFLARLHGLLRDRAPDLLEALFAAGVETLRFRDMAAELVPGATLLPDDDEITLLACRRLTFEWVLRRHVEGLDSVTLMSDAVAQGLLADPAGAGLPVVRGVRWSRGRAGPSEDLAADLVVDASGRRTRIADWLTEIGAPTLRAESEPCGIFYSSRFYALREGAEMPSIDRPMAADLGFLKYGIFPGDARTFALTLAASPDDAPLRALFHGEPFDAVANLLPLVRPWVDPALSRPISDVVPMANLHNTRRFLVDGGEPVALGLACVGDALMHTNPIVGRGCTLAFVNAYALADALRDQPFDLRAFALDLDARVERELVPWYENVRTQDRDAIAVNELLRHGDDPHAMNRPDGSVDPRAMMRAVVRDGLLPAMREDVGVLRAFMRIFNLLDEPADLMKDPRILTRVMDSYQRRHDRPPTDQPSRSQVVERLEALAA